MRLLSTIKSISAPAALNGCVPYKNGPQYSWRDESETIAPDVSWIYSSSVDVTAETPEGELEGVATGQVVSAELINGGISNAANWLSVGDAIAVDTCLGGEVSRTPDVYGTCLWAPGYDLKPSFREMYLGLSNNK